MALTVNRLSLVAHVDRHDRDLVFDGDSIELRRRLSGAKAQSKVITPFTESMRLATLQVCLNLLCTVTLFISSLAATVRFAPSFAGEPCIKSMGFVVQ